MKHRSQEQITALILEAANYTNSSGSGATQTIIMYKAYLTYVQLKDYLSFLIEKGLIEYHRGERVYRTTDKGKHFLQIYNQLDNIFNAIRQI
jgi:predicted transcriptional regulator